MLPNPLPVEAAEGCGNMREEEAERHTRNRARYPDIYDAWHEESPACISETFTEEIRKFLKGGAPGN